MCYLTVFTPTYNRAYCLENLYKSLLRQTNGDFEWLVIDDGSTDGTGYLVEKWKADNRLPITFIKTLNGGKHRAINKGVTFAQGKYFFIVDSDDYLTDDAIETIFLYGKQVENDDSFAGICGLRIFSNGKIIGREMKFELLDASSVEFRERSKIKGDMAEVFKTEILKSYPFPEFACENFIKESVVWNRIALKFKLRYFNKPIYVCDYLNDGLTRSIRKHLKNNPLGNMLANRELCGMPVGYFTKIRAGINYWRYSPGIIFTYRKKIPPFKWMYFLYLGGVFFYLKDLFDNVRRNTKL